MASQNPWFRLYTEMVDDEKLRLLAFEDRWHYVALLCCKGKGLIDSTDDPMMVARKLSVKLGLTVRELETVIMRLEEVGLVDSATFQPTGWDSRQFVSDTSTERVQAYRERMKRSRNVSVTAQDTDTDTDTEDRKKKSTVQPAAARSRFDDFWHVYPNKKGKQEAEKRWRKDKLDGMADQIIAHVHLMRRDDDGWMRGYIPMGSTYLNQARWTDVPQAAPTDRSTPVSKTMQGIMKLEAMKNGLDDSGNHKGVPAATLPWPGTSAISRNSRWDGNGLGNGHHSQQGMGSAFGRPALLGSLPDDDGFPD